MELNSVMYQGMTVPEYCKENNIPFKSVLEVYRRMINNKKLKITEEEMIDYIIKRVQSHIKIGKIKTKKVDENESEMYIVNTDEDVYEIDVVTAYNLLKDHFKNTIYDGMTVEEYCNKNGILFESAFKIYFRQRNNEQLDDKADIQLVDYILKRLKKRNNAEAIKYYIDGLSVSEYACAHGYIPASLRNSIRAQLRENPEKTIAEAVKTFEKNVEERKLKLSR
jgi:hypothetical protein